MVERSGQLDWVDVVMKKKYFIVAASLICGIVAFGASFVMTKTYQSSLALKVGIVSYAASKGTGFEITTDYIETTRTVKDLIESEPFMAEVISRMKLDITPSQLLERIDVKIATDTPKEEENRLVLVTAEAAGPEKVVMLLETTADLIRKRHKELYGEAVEVQHKYEEEIKHSVSRISEEIQEMKSTLARVQAKPGIDAPAVILLAAGIEGREETLADLRRELSLVQSLTRTSMKSEESRVVLPPFTPTEPVSPKPRLNLLAGLFVGGVLAGCYEFFRAYLEAREA